MLTLTGSDPKRPGSDGAVSLGMRAPSPPAYSHSQLHVLPAHPSAPAHMFKFKTYGRRLGPPGAKGVVREVSAKVDGALLAGDGAALGVGPDGVLRMRLEARMVKPPGKFQRMMGKGEEEEAGSTVSLE